MSQDIGGGRTYVWGRPRVAVCDSAYLVGLLAKISGDGDGRTLTLRGDSDGGVGY
jgi:hypothetical protein